MLARLEYLVVFFEKRNHLYLPASPSAGSTCTVIGSKCMYLPGCPHPVMPDT